MSKRFQRTTRVVADVVIWDGNNSRDLAELLGKPVTAQPEGDATWPDDNEGVQTAPLGHAILKYADGPDEGEVDVIEPDLFAQTFAQIRPRNPKPNPASVTELVAAKTGVASAPEPAAAGKAAQAADA